MVFFSRIPGYVSWDGRGAAKLARQAGEAVRNSEAMELNEVSLREMNLSRPRLSRPYRQLAIAATLLCTSAAMLPARAVPQSAKSWAKRAADAEAHEDYDAAFEAYRQALLQRPQNLIYRTKFERIRFAAAAAHVDRGRVLRQSGDLNGALTEFQRALAIDGGNQTAQQEIVAVEREMSNAPDAALQQQAPLGPSAAAATVAGPIQLKAVQNDPVTLNMVADTKEIYQALGKLAGLNVIFDPDYTSRRVPVDLRNVSLYEALRIVGQLSGTFWKPVTQNTIFVAANTQTKRTELEQLAVQTFYLSNAAASADQNEILTALRNILSPSTKIFLVPSQNAIVMRSTPDQLLLVESLLNNLDRPRSEVVVDVAVLEVNKTRTRNLGITLPQSVSVGTQLNESTSNTVTSSSATSSTSTSTSTTGTSTTTAAPSLNQLANFTASNIAVSVGTAAVNALLTDSDTRVLQNPRLRATDGQKASVKIGSRIPIATGSFSNGLGTGSISGIGAVNTQFQYIDVGVNVEVTPTVHQDREVTLKLKLEVSSQTGTVNISGVSQPIIGQRTIDQTIQLKEGEPSILAGLNTQEEDAVVSGTPGFASVPILNKILGSNQHVKTDDEIVFLLIPHIVREPLITRLNTRAIDSGTSDQFQLRRDETLVAPGAVDNSALVTTGALQRSLINPRNMTAAQAASAMIGQVSGGEASRAAQDAVNVQGAQQGPTPAQVEQAANGPLGSQAAVTPVTFTVTAPSTQQAVGSTFQVAVGAANAKDLYAAPLQLQFDPKILSLVNVDSGEMLGRDGQAVSIVHRDEGNGLVTVSISRPPAVRGVDGSGNVAVLTFKAVAPGDSTLSLVKVAAKNSAQGNVPAVGSKSVVHVK